ncbi:hypothetical protein HPB50_017695 [Hyalomma asiaticum]|uniref:Uncharacterized protein n=1 Tax=Hyalomma asiaticum TaxID=266040 RepID=A0ACB7SM52_HYAAI|nr:hypothetical protein HPB50_017695 [Hyalomma asiaticum]
MGDNPPSPSLRRGRQTRAGSTHDSSRVAERFKSSHLGTEIGDQSEDWQRCLRGGRRGSLGDTAASTARWMSRRWSDGSETRRRDSHDSRVFVLSVL